jgi:serine/threonine-protein kinase
MAEVWKARAVLESGESHHVAVKRVLGELAAEPLYRSMFEDEARLGMLLRHPNIVRVHDAREVQGAFLMVMELVDGTSLKSLLDRAHARGACMPVPAALHVMREVAKALEYAHGATDARGEHLAIIHRDVSPHNVLLSRSGAVKLTDFGLADASVHQTMRSSELVGGKLGYLAPEVVLQKGGDHRIDIFAAGIVLWEMLAGRRLFKGESDSETVHNVVRKPIEKVSTYNTSVSPEIDALVARVLDRNPERRFKSARALLDAIEMLLGKVDPTVGARDVSLLVGLHLAAGRPETPQKGVEALIAELDAFVVAADGVGLYDVGATPLDPASFGSSGVRPLPSEDD